MLNIFTLFLAAYFLLDALHDKFLLEARPIISDRSKDRLWHFIDSVIKGGVAMLVLYLMGLKSLWLFGLYAVYFMAFRAFWFNFWLNLFRKNVFAWHLSNSGIEGYFVKQFGVKAYWFSAFFTILLLYTILKLIG